MTGGLMKCVIRWKTFVNSRNSLLAEAKITEDLEAGGLPFEACHQGPMMVSLSCTDPFNI
jgi:hypothetical protein